MGSPVSIVVAEIIMQNIKEQALATYSETFTLRLRFVNNAIAAVHKNKIYEFHEYLNKQNTSVQLAKEIKENGKIPSPDCFVTKKTIPYEPLFTGNQHTLTD